MKNARFWTYYNGQHTKLTLKPNQTLDYDKCGPDEEGYSFQAESYDYDGETGLITCDVAYGGRDCDGTIYHHDTFVCHVDDLESGNVVGRIDGWDDYRDGKNPEMIRFPNWVEESSYHRDPQAEAAGY